MESEISAKNVNHNLDGGMTDVNEVDIVQSMDLSTPESIPEPLLVESPVLNKNIEDREEGGSLVGLRSIDLNSEDLNFQENKIELDMTCQNSEEITPQLIEPVLDGTEVPGMAASESVSTRSLDSESGAQGSVWPEKAIAIRNLVREKSAVALSTVLQRLSGRSDEDPGVENKTVVESRKDQEQDGTKKEGELNSPKPNEMSGWNPLNFIKISSDTRAESDQTVSTEGYLSPIFMKGRILLYTQLGCQESKELRKFMYMKRLPYVEINIDIYPSRKVELEKVSGSSTIPRVFFNKVCVGGLRDLKNMDEAGEFAEKINNLINEEPPVDAPLPPMPGEDDLSVSTESDEMTVIVQKMRHSISVKDRLYKMRWFTSCFLGSEAVEFISEDQYLERDEAVEFGRQLASQFFFLHVLDENLLEDGNHVYRFLDQDPVISQCHNIPRGLLDTKPKPIVELAAMLGILCSAMFEAYVSEDGKHVDYRSIHGSEEFARYLRIVEELQRVDMMDMKREEKLAFFINLFNMMAIHAILVFGHPAGPLERRKLYGDFKYVIGGCAYSLSAFHNGILRGNQRPPYNFIKPFSGKDKRAKIALPYAEPLVHFTLVCGNRSGPALRCYSPGNIDKELVEAAREFIQGGGLIVDVNGKAVFASQILKWYSVDFGKNEVEVLKHAANYLAPSESEPLLELLATTQLKVTYQPYDWRLNH